LVPRDRRELSSGLRRVGLAQRMFGGERLDRHAVRVDASGDRITVADICLAAHLTSAKLFGGREPADYPTAGRIYANCIALEAFAAEHPLRQPDAPKT
ncbi:MAG TPA: hypothetical protein VJT13_21200, partial [Xanthobacteraceae bacterium]|nr:hypothetical protein [Xanthobacteraceae bacterium]